MNLPANRPTSHAAPCPGPDPVSPWLRRWPQACPAGGRALDLACGSGRHTRFLAGLGMQVTAVDRDAEITQGLDAVAELLLADLEAGPWPLAGRQFDLVLVSNYLWRPLMPNILASLAPGGWLIYETFAQGQERLGRPRRPEFLLAHGELLQLCAGLRIVAYEDGLEPAETPDVNPRQVQRVAAVREPPQTEHPPAYLLPRLQGGSRA